MTDNRVAQQHIWIVSEVFWPEETGTGYFMTGLAEGLSGDFDVGVICGQPTYSRRGLRAPRREHRQGVHIRRVRSTTLDKDLLVGRALNVASMTLSLSWELFRMIRRGDIVIVVTNPPVLPYFAAMVSTLRGVLYVVIVHDMFPFHMIAAGMIAEESIITKSISALNRRLYRGARGVTVLGRDLKERVLSIVGNSETVVRIVTSWADLDTIHARSRNPSRLLQDLGLVDKFIVQYAGNIGPLQDIPCILDAMTILSAQDQRHIHLLVVGSGRMRSWMEEEISRRELDNVTIVDPVPRDDADEIHRACDIALVSLIDGMLGVAVPSRTYNFLAAGRPIVAAVDPQSEVGLLVADNSIGWVTGAGDGEALAEALRTAALNPDLTAEMGLRARRIAEETYSRDLVVRRMREFLRDIASNAPVH